MLKNKEYNSLEEFRIDIDKLDSKLVGLISDRTHLIRKVSSFKTSVKEVKAIDRINFIIQQVRHQAIELGISPNMISDLFNIMIDEMVETEIAEFRNTKTF